MSATKETHPLYLAALKADADWQAELVSVYGQEAGNARYDRRGIATPTLQKLRTAKLLADKAWYAYRNKSDQTI